MAKTSVTMFRLPVALIRRYSIFAGVLLAAIWLWVAFDRPYRFPTHAVWNIYSYHPQAPDSSSETLYDVFDFPPVNSEAIRSICSDTQWNDSIIFTCRNSVGGIGNIRNSILNCVRYAISAGGGLVVPEIIVRNDDNISEIRTGVRTTMDYMFDTEHFIKSLGLSCPELRLFSSLDVIRNSHNVLDPVPLLPEEIVEGVPSTGLPHPEEWPSQFYSWVDENAFPGGEGSINIIELGRSYLQYPIYTDGEGFALSFGGILKLRSDARILAASILIKLNEVYSFGLDISQPFLKDAFFGAHLRTEKDSQEGWPVHDWMFSRYDTQSKLYLEQATQSKLSVIYVASGDTNEIAKFSREAAALNMTVTTKFELLSDNDRKQLESLTWDQQALVDFLIMLKASEFAGIAHSSFAWNVALKRHSYAKTKSHLDGPQMLSDELSQIYGLPRGYPEYAACLWP